MIQCLGLVMVHPVKTRIAFEIRRSFATIALKRRKKWTEER
jgi:hypothetical protein